MGNFLNVTTVDQVPPGKLKTVLQFASLLLLLWPGPGRDLLQPVGWWLFWPSLLLALSSAWGYLRRG